MATAVRKIFSPSGTRLPSSDMMPSAKAMSVAMGMPHPAADSWPAFREKKMSAGTTMPPTAAATGMMVRLGVDNPPTSSSRLISRPTRKKKMAMSPSLIHRMAALDRTQSPTPTVILVCHRAW